jgi:hypothetical protein
VDSIESPPLALFPLPGSGETHFATDIRSTDNATAEDIEWLTPALRESCSTRRFALSTPTPTRVDGRGSAVPVGWTWRANQHPLLSAVHDAVKCLARPACLVVLRNILKSDPETQTKGRSRKSFLTGWSSQARSCYRRRRCSVGHSLVCRVLSSSCLSEAVGWDCLGKQACPCLHVQATSLVSRT